MVTDPLNSQRRKELMAEFGIVFETLYIEMLATPGLDQETVRRNPMYLARICLLKAAARFQPATEDAAYQAIRDAVSGLR